MCRFQRGSWQTFMVFFSFSFKFLNLFFEGKKHQLTGPFFNVFMGCLLYVPDQRWNPQPWCIGTTLRATELPSQGSHGVLADQAEKSGLDK